MRQYLQDPSHLQRLPESDAQKLGLFLDGTYAEYKAAAEASSIPSPKLIITIVGATHNQCYPILENEWERFQDDAPLYCTRPSEVWVVDGSKYTAPI